MTQLFGRLGKFIPPSRRQNSKESRTDACLPRTLRDGGTSQPVLDDQRVRSTVIM